MTIDANILVAYLDNEKVVIEKLSEWRRERRPLFLSAVAEAEVLSFPLWTPSEKAAVEKFLEEGFTPLAFDRTIARLAAAIRRDVNIKLPDAAIAATAIYTNTSLVTRNIRDFKKINGLSLLKI